MRLMGLDVGSHTIGVAISDELGMTAQPIKTIRRKSKEEDVREIKAIIAEYEIIKIVVGLPKNMDGTLGKQAEIIFRWIKALQEEIKLPMITWDERLSTVGASRVLLEADLSREKRKKVIDKLAAVLILQGYLDKTRKPTNDSAIST
ncbi:MAG: Holliday junction resolvase RuvX [Deltaproteobacteria bacterium]